jgi:endonuclease/exonuclease/phosphatase family metal-dependent hydrolase
MSKALKILGIIAAAFVTLVVALLILIRLSTYHPADIEAAEMSCPAETPKLKPGQNVKVMSWNVQYMAGKNYVFYYDLLDGSGPDVRPSRQDIEATFAEVARVIREENPDVVLLQEMDQGAKRTDKEDQHARLLEMLKAQNYACHAQAFYWKAGFVPHPKVMGPVGLKLSTFSRFHIDSATRRALPMLKQDWLTDQFYLKRAILETALTVDGRPQPFVALNTHLDAFAQGTDTMERQVAYLSARLAELEASNTPWVSGGDYNLLPPGDAYDRLIPEKRLYYKPKSELEPLFGLYQAVPSAAQTQGPDAAKWFTHFPNDPTIKAPDRTIDFIFISKHLNLGQHSVRLKDTLKISDHMPILAEVTLQ